MTGITGLGISSHRQNRSWANFSGVHVGGLSGHSARACFVKLEFSNDRYADQIKADTRPGIPQCIHRDIRTIMGANIVDFQKVRDRKSAEIDAEILNYYLYLPPTLTPQQCAQGREMLNWSHEALAFRSGASLKAIQEFESGSRELRTVTRQALAYALEAEGLLLFPGYKPVKSNGCPGATLDPRQRNDFYLIE